MFVSMSTKHRNVKNVPLKEACGIKETEVCHMGMINRGGEVSMYFTIVTLKPTFFVISEA